MPAARMLGKLTFTLEVPQADGTKRKRGFALECGSVTGERCVGDRGEEIFQLPLEIFESLFMVDGVHAEVRHAHRTLVLYSLPKGKTDFIVEDERPLIVGQRVRAVAPERGHAVRKPGTEGTVVEMPANCPGYDGFVKWDDGSDSCPVEAGQYEVVQPVQALKDFERGVTSGMEAADLGRIAYDGYCKSTGGKSAITGEALPAWDALPQPVRDGWIASAQAVRQAPTIWLQGGGAAGSGG